MGQCSSSLATPEKKMKTQAPLEEVFGVVRIDDVKKASSGSMISRLWNHKRVAVAAESNVASHVSIVIKPEATKDLIAHAIKDNLLFQDMPAAALDVIIDSMHSMAVPAGTDIIQQGCPKASEFYVLEEGSAEVWVKPKGGGAAAKVLAYGPGSTFGELALLFNAPRAATVKATTPCKLWVMQRTVYHAVKRNFTHEAFAARHKLLDTVPALQGLSSHHRALLVDALQQVEFASGKAVFRKGDPGNDFFIVREGAALVKDGGQVLTRLGPGQFFGERALLGADVRAADVVAEGRLVCYCLSRSDFVELLGSQDDIWRMEALKKVPILYSLTERQLWSIARELGQESWQQGEVVFRKGDPGDKFYIVQKGAFTVFDAHGKELARIGEGSCFGELALLRQEARAATVMALTDSKVLTLSREQFNRLLGNLQDMRHVWRFESLRKVPLLSGLGPAELAALAGALHPVSIRASQDVIQQGEAGDVFYIVEHGELAAYKSGQGLVARYQPRSYFGELALLTNEPRAASVRAVTDCSLLALERDNFNRLMGPLVPALQAEAEAAYKMGGWAKKKKAFQVSEVQAVAVLGQGGFGQVLLVSYKGEHKALKCVSKAFVMEQGLAEHIKHEKQYQLECDSPFLVRLDGAAQDEATLYMLMEVVMGGELFTYLQTRSKPLDEAHARFYAASVVLAFEYLHDRELIYRDLKPENLLIDLTGYVKVTDFGFVKRVKAGSKTYTLCGTPEYLAPEVIMNKGHSFQADWWALGILIFELCTGLPPFMHDDRLTMFRKICSRDMKVPRSFSEPLAHLVQRLLEPNPVFRLGCGRAGANEIKKHPWFKGFDWDAFAARRMPAPYIPKQPKHGGDACNFAPMQADAKIFRPKPYKSQGAFADF